MRAFARWIACAAALFGLASLPAGAAAPLFAIGPDANGIGRVFTPIVPGGSATALGDGNSAVNGGLAHLPSANRFYAIENDAFGQSSLTSFAAATPAVLSTPVSLGSGFLGGLAADPAAAKLYAIASDALGQSTLYRVGSGGATALGAIGRGYFGGMTFDTLDHDLYAITSDDLGVQRRLARITLDSSATPTATTLFDLGDGSLGFQGGLAFDAALKRFVVIGNDSSGNSALYGFSLSGASSLTDLAAPLGPGFFNAGLAYAAAVPEVPSAWMFGVIGLPMLGWARRRAARSTVNSILEG